MPVPVINISQMREWEKATWASGQTESTVISLVGQSVARQALQLTKPQDLILILAGKGHNGEDARSAREHLVERRGEPLNIKKTPTEFSKFDASPFFYTALIFVGFFGIVMYRPLKPPLVVFI